MSVNGMDAGNAPDASSKTARHQGAELTIEADGADASPLQLSRIALRTPAGVTVRDPLLDRRAAANVKQAYRELRFALEAARRLAGVRTIGVVSLNGGDGRSLVAANMALSFTLGGRRRVALVDACFERPSVARLLDAEAPVGLAEVLAGHASLEAALFASEREGLFALSSGNPEAIGLEPLDALDMFGAVVDRLATVFDFVVVDTPPLNASVDGAAFASKLDGVVMVVRARKTTASAIEQAIARFGAGKIVGLVLNDAG